MHRATLYNRPFLARATVAALVLALPAVAVLARHGRATAVAPKQTPATPPQPATATPHPTAPAAAPPAATETPTPTPGPISRNVVVLDPAHGGSDGGSRIGDTLLEKDVTLAFAFRLRALLVARGFTVAMTREADAPMGPGGQPLTLDDRAGIANHPHAVACLLLHATAAGTGVHLYGSELNPAPVEVALLPWLTAQAAWVPQSGALKTQLGLALTRAGIPLVSSRASVRPVDSLTCPAVVVELAPEGDDPGSISGADYQQRVATALAGALVFWPRQAQPPPRMPAPPRHTAEAAAPAPHPAKAAPPAAVPEVLP